MILPKDQFATLVGRKPQRPPTEPNPEIQAAAEAKRDRKRRRNLRLEHKNSLSEET